MQKITFITVGIIAACFNTVKAEDTTGKSAISTEISTTGIGFDYIYGVSPTLHLRAGVNGLRVGYDVDAEDNDGEEGNELNYEGDIKLFSLGGSADWYPTGGNFRITAGLFFNGNEVDGEANCEQEQGQCEFGDDGDTYSREQLGTISYTAEFQPIAPYLGIGYGNPLKNSGWGFSADVGVLFQGSADVELSSNGRCSTGAGDLVGGDEQCQDFRDNQIENEEREIEEDVEDLRYYPVINLALTYRF